MKEKTSRDKALEFAKNVPKPKVSAQSTVPGGPVRHRSNKNNGAESSQGGQLEYIREEQFDEMG